jgi:hypothetical protein
MIITHLPAGTIHALAEIEVLVSIARGLTHGIGSG